MKANKHGENPNKLNFKKTFLIISIAVIMILIGSLIAIPIMVMPMFLGQHYDQTIYESLDYGVRSERITLTTEDSLNLAAWRTRAAEPKGTVIILSGIQNPSVTAFFGYAKMLSDNGWDSMLIEMRARGESEGNDIGLGMTEWRDVQAGVDYLLKDEDISELPIVVMGTSMGGGTAIIAAGEIPEIDAVIAMSAFSSWPDLFVDNMASIGIPKVIGVLDIPFLKTYLGFHYGFDALKYSPQTEIEKLGDRPILLMHSTDDSQIPFSEFEKNQTSALRYNIDLEVLIREGDHHFIVLDEYFDDPIEDKEFSTAILTFLAENFE